MIGWRQQQPMDLIQVLKFKHKAFFLKINILKKYFLKTQNHSLAITHTHTIFYSRLDHLKFKISGLSQTIFFHSMGHFNRMTKTVHWVICWIVLTLTSF